MPFCRRLILVSPLLLLAAACSLWPWPRRPQPVVASGPEGLAPEQEAVVLRLEDRREYDSAVVQAWITRSNPLQRARIALALARIGPHDFIDANGNRERDPGEKSAGVDELAALIADPDVDTRRNAAFALGEIGDPAAVETLFRFGADEHGDVAAEAVEALSKLARDVPLERYRAFAAPEQREGVRARAIEFLFRFASDEASSIAAGLLADPAPLMREQAAYALSRRAYAPARDALQLLLTDPAARIRAYAARAIGQIGDPASIGSLISSLLDPHPWVRTNVLRAITQIATKDPSAVRTVELLRDASRIIVLTDDADPGTRAVAVETLGFYAPLNTAARDRLVEIATQGSRWEREIAAAAVAAHLPENGALLDRLLQDASPAGIRGVLDAAASLSSGPQLRRRFAASPDPTVRAAAVGTIPDDHADAEIDLIRDGLADPDEGVRANAVDRYAHQVIDSPAKVVETLRSSERRADEVQDDVRLAVITALAGIDFPDRETFLRERVNDSDPVIRRVSAELIRDKLKKNLPKYTPLPIERPIAEYAEIAAWASGRHTASIQMPRGMVNLFLLTADAPMTCWNFAQLARKGYFDDTTFMRVVPNFVVQGGDRRGDQSGGPGYAIRDEINLQRYTRGAVGMALSGPDTGGSQFFITHSPQPHLDGGYTVFARVISGMGGVVDQIERGDRVATISIDAAVALEHPDIAAIEVTPLPTEVGPTTPDRLLNIVPEYRERMDAYRPDDAVLEVLSSSLQPGDRIEVFLGTWCTDSQREVPKFLKIVDLLRTRYGVDVPVSYVAVDRTRDAPGHPAQGKSIAKVSTFILYRDGVEKGRIEETPSGLLEDDLLGLATKK